MTLLLLVLLTIEARLEYTLTLVRSWAWAFDATSDLKRDAALEVVQQPTNTITPPRRIPPFISILFFFSSSFDNGDFQTKLAWLQDPARSVAILAAQSRPGR